MVAEHPMPTVKDEMWRYTAVKELLSALDVAVTPDQSVELEPGQVDLLAGDHGGPRLVFLNGRFAPSASRCEPIEGLTMAPFSDTDHAGTSRSMLTANPVDERNRSDGFLALNQRDGQDGASLHIAAGAEVTVAIHVVHIAAPSEGQTALTHPAAVIEVGAGARAVVVESYVGLNGASLTNASTTIEVADGARLDYYRVQNETPSANHVGHVRARVGRDAHFAATSFSIGASVSRVAIDATAEGDGSTIDLDGLYLPAGNERHDHVLIVEHLGSHTSSNQRFKGIIDGRAHGSFTGHIIVAPATVDTSAHQTNHSLLLTSTAESDTRPWLEILADDVRCTHGATIGRLDDAALFYLRSRAIPEATARHMLVDAFAREIVESVSIESLQEFLVSAISAKQTSQVMA